MSENTLFEIEADFSSSKHLLIQLFNVKHIHTHWICRIRFNNLKWHFHYDVFISHCFCVHLLPSVDNPQPWVLFCLSYLFPLFKNMNFISWRKSRNKVKVLLRISFCVNVLRLHKFTVFWDPYESFKLLFAEEWSKLRIPKFLFMFFEESWQHNYKKRYGEYNVDNDLNSIPYKSIESYSS